MAASHAAKKAVWLHHLMSELGYPQKGLTIIHEDSTGCIGMSKNPIHHSTMKHFAVHQHFVRERVKRGEVILQKITSQLQVADVFTKALGKVKFVFHQDKLIWLWCWGVCWFQHHNLHHSLISLLILFILFLLFFLIF